MKILITNLLLISTILVINGCAYNSRNIIEVSGEKLTFSYGLISIKDVSRVLLYRETNAGGKDGPKPLPVFEFSKE